MISAKVTGYQRHLTDFPKSLNPCTQLLVEKRSTSLLIQWEDCSSSVSYLFMAMFLKNMSKVGLQLLHHSKVPLDT
uniref:Uncharacterized protein n=1 Tax=Arundo donax TaxID=35708 RepID=A0A0A9CZY3_ARUDO